VSQATHILAINEPPAWLDFFPALKAVDDPAWTGAMQHAQERLIPANTRMFGSGEACNSFILIISGSVRVYMTFENGRDMVLYHLQSGECCSLTSSTLLSGTRYQAFGLTESETRIVLVSKQDFHAAFDQSTGFRQFVCAGLSGRINEMLLLLGGLGMRNIEARLARWLLDNRTESDCVAASHRELASELGTAREVISRHLKDFEKKGLVRLSRKFIELSDVAALDSRICSFR
jgi:CRP/FNR family transcriptional regulator